jgi:hypothetical protein
VHYTIGGPFYEEFRDCSYSAEWFAERQAMLHCGQWPRQQSVKILAKTGT